MGEIEQTGLSRRDLMTGLGVGAGAGLVIAAGLPLTAAAAPSRNVPAWLAFPKDFSPAISNLTYLGIDGSAFHTYAYTPNGRRLDETSGAGILTDSQRLATPLLLPVGSVIRQINIAYLGTPIVEVFKRDLTTDTQSWNPSEFQQTAPNDPSPGAHTHTFDLTSPITIEPGATYSLQLWCGVADSVYGITLGYTPPTAGFVPFTGPMPRVLDTRTSGNRLTFGQEIEVDLGNPGVRGALFNLTVTETENGGFVAAFAADVAYPGNSSVNYTATGQTVANGVVSAVSPDGKIKLRGGGPVGSAHVIVDRLGWFI